ncbi:MAG: hypothetical protein ACE5KM_04195 [Planctomycetaceae bacterium]
MTRKTVRSWLRALACGLGLMAAAVGCQSGVGGQTLPSGYYLLDDIQYFRPGQEDILANQRRALADYRAGRQAAQDGVGGGPPAPAAP